MKKNNKSGVWMLVLCYVFMIGGIYLYRKINIPVVATPVMHHVKPPAPDTLYLTGTVYSSTRLQVKKYIYTASGRLVRNDTSMTSQRIISLSQDIVADNGYHFGDTLFVLSDHPLLNGPWVYEDCMHYDQVNRCDFMVARKDIKKFIKGIYNVKILKYDGAY